MFNTLAQCPEFLRQWLEQQGSQCSVASEKEIIKEGEQSGSLYFLRSGTAKVRTRQGPNSVELAELASGEIFGEMSFVDDRPPVASIIAGNDCSVLKIDKEKLKRSLSSDPRLAHAFYQLIGKKLATQLISQNQLIHRWPGIDVEPLRKVLVIFAILSEVDIEWLARHGIRNSYERGHLIIQEGQGVPGLVLVLAGEGEVFIQVDGHEKLVGTSRRGEFLGEMTLLGSSDTATASIRSKTDIELLKISKENLEREFAQNINFAARFYNSLAVLLSQRLRDQLRSRGMASRAFEAESIDDESISLEQMTAITVAGQRFEWLCQSIL